jgi:rubrerythrin
MAAAIEQLASDPVSRRRFARALAGAGAAASLAALLAACGGDEPTESGTKTAQGGDLGLLNYALTLEYLEADFYAQVTSSGLFKGREQKILEQVLANERAHVELLKSSAEKLGRPAERPEGNFDEVLDGGRKKALSTAARLEDLGAAAYLGAAREITSPKILAAALSIHSVEGRHAAVLNHLAGKPFSPDGAFATPLSRDEVLGQASVYIA